MEDISYGQTYNVILEMKRGLLVHSRYITGT